MKVIVDLDELGDETAFYVEQVSVPFDDNAIIIIPEGATNGDMIKAMFPICCSNMGNLDNGIVVDFMGDLHTFNKGWWNAPYKTESGE